MMEKIDLNIYKEHNLCYPLFDMHSLNKTNNEEIVWPHKTKRLL